MGPRAGPGLDPHAQPATATDLVSYRYYAVYIGRNVMRLDPARLTPVRRNDGLDDMPTNRYVLCGHHFAAVAGARLLVGPVLVAQMGYLPGMRIPARLP